MTHTVAHAADPNPMFRSIEGVNSANAAPAYGRSAALQRSSSEAESDMRSSHRCSNCCSSIMIQGLLPCGTREKKWRPSTPRRHKLRSRRRSHMSPRATRRARIQQYSAVSAAHRSSRRPSTRSGLLQERPLARTPFCQDDFLPGQLFCSGSGRADQPRSKMSRIQSAAAC
jgi:hypothetical protein